jgi:transposase
LIRLSKGALIVALIARIDALVAENTALRTRVAELEAKLGLPPKTPNNSSTPPSQGRKTSDDAASKPKGKPHAGAHRPLHPNPTGRRDMMATACQHCGANVSSAPQIACEAYDAIEIPEIKPDITRVTLFGGTCPCRAKRFKASPPQGLEPGSPPELVEGRAEPARIRRLSALHARHLIRASGKAFVRYSRARHQRGSTGSP